MKTWFMFFAVGSLFSLSTPSLFAGPDADTSLDSLRVVDLQQDIQDLLDRVDKLEKEKGPSWLDRFTFKGDFRYRHEYIDTDDDGKSHRTRHRIRARFFVGAEIFDDLDFGLQIASGSDDPVSSNQTIGDFFSTKSLQLDLAYLDYHPAINSESSSLSFVAGKMKTPFVVMSKSELLWDPDLRPEGIAAKYSRETDAFEFFSSLGGFWIEERSGKEDTVLGDNTGRSADTVLFGAQAGVVVPLDDNSLTLGAGIYDYGNIKGYNFYNGDPAGNTGIDLDGDGTGDQFAEDYNQVEYFGEFAFEAADLPVHVFGNYVNNLAADKEDVGWLAGFKVGKAKDPGTWDFRYQYKDLERDAVMAVFTDSDFGGGGTDAQGHEFNLGYAVAKNWNLALTYFLNEVDVSSTDDKDYQRIQFDIKLKF
jgi:hypothetical protein